jgi:hypothetical protein
VLQQIDSHMTKHCHILWTMIDPNMRRILVHNHIQVPMQLILDLPLTADTRRKAFDRSIATTNEIAR